MSVYIPAKNVWQTGCGSNFSANVSGVGYINDIVYLLDLIERDLRRASLKSDFALVSRGYNALHATDLAYDLVTDGTFPPRSDPKAVMQELRNATAEQLAGVASKYSAPYYRPNSRGAAVRYDWNITALGFLLFREYGWDSSASVGFRNYQINIGIIALSLVVSLLPEGGNNLEEPFLHAVAEAFGVPPRMKRKTDLAIRSYNIGDYLSERNRKSLRKSGQFSVVLPLYRNKK